jgi:hypothetical protein
VAALTAMTAVAAALAASRRGPLLRVAAATLAAAGLSRRLAGVLPHRGEQARAGAEPIRASGRVERRTDELRLWVEAGSRPARVTVDPRR